MAGHKRRSRTRTDRLRNTIRLGVVFAVLVGVNVYVFLLRPGNIRDLKKQIQPNATRDAMDGGGAGAGPSAAAAVPGAGAAAAKRPAVEELDGPRAGREVRGEVRRGDNLKKLLLRESLEPPEAEEVIRALRDGGLDVNAIREKQGYVLRFDDDGRLVGFELKISTGVVYLVERGADGRLKARKAEAKSEVRIEEVSGRVTSSLYEAVKSAGEDTELVAEMADLFSYDINFFTETHAGDRFAAVVEKIYVGNEFHRYGRILAAEYSGRVGTYRAFFWQAPGAPAGAYYDEQGQNIAKTFLKTPLKFVRVSSSFNPRRMHPILHVVRGHYGTDFAAPTGTPVWASASGRVVKATFERGPGNIVVIDHGNGLETHYMHLSRFAKGLSAGQIVKAKQVIGYVGSTGLSTGPHLHFGVKQKGRWVDSQKLRSVREAPVPKKHLVEFRAAIAPRVATLGRLTSALTATAAPPTPHAQ